MLGAKKGKPMLADPAFAPFRDDAQIGLQVTLGHQTYPITNVELSECHSCKKFAVWAVGRLVYPPSDLAIEPHADMPAGIQADFIEAASIVNASPRGAAALLRLCLQKLCDHLLKTKGQKIDVSVGQLVAQGLPPEVQKALDSVRVIGNEAVHPGSMDLSDDKETALALFNLVNYITDRLISQPKKIAEIYDMLPESKRNGIESRDKKITREGDGHHA